MTEIAEAKAETAEAKAETDKAKQKLKETQTSYCQKFIRKLSIR